MVAIKLKSVIQNIEKMERAMGLGRKRYISNIKSLGHKPREIASK